MDSKYLSAICAGIALEIVDEKILQPVSVTFVPSAGIDIAEGFDWDRVWNAYVETTKACLSRAKAHSLKFSIEQDQHPGDPDMRETCREYLRIMREYI